MMHLRQHRFLFALWLTFALSASAQQVSLTGHVDLTKDGHRLKDASKAVI